MGYISVSIQYKPVTMWTTLPLLLFQSSFVRLWNNENIICLDKTHCVQSNVKYSSNYQILSLSSVCVYRTWFNIGNCLLYLAIYYHFSLEGPLAFKSAAGCLIVEDSLLGPLNCSLGTMDSFVNVFLFLSLDNTRGSFWLSALKKCLQNYTSLCLSKQV